MEQFQTQQEGITLDAGQQQALQQVMMQGLPIQFLQAGAQFPTTLQGQQQQVQ